MKYALSGVALALLISTTVSAETQKPDHFIGQISKIDLNRTAIGADRQMIRAERLTFNQFTNCEHMTTNMTPDSVGMSIKEYKQFLQKTWELAQNEEFFYIKTTSCDGPATDLITQITPCTADLCGAEYVSDHSIKWFNSELDPSYKSSAAIGIKTPLPYDKKKKQWHVVGYYVKDGKLSKHKAIDGYTSKEKLTTLSFVGKQTTYFRSGEVKKISHYNNKGELDGVTTHYFTNGKVHQTVHYTNNVVNGEVNTFHKNGRLENKEFFILGKHKDGECKHYDENGKLSRIHSYKDGNYDGEYIDYFLNGKKQTVATYHMGSPLKRTTYFDNGKVKRTYVKTDKKTISEDFNAQGIKIRRQVDIKVKNGTQMAERELWYDDGQPHTTEYYGPGFKKNGTFNDWFKNGQLRSEEVFINGKPVSEKSWTIKGKLVKEHYYKEGKLHGTQRRWDDKSGHLIEEENYQLGKKDGLQREWDRNTGFLVDEVTYKNGTPSSINKTYDGETGELQLLQYIDARGFPLKTLVNGEAPVKRYHKGKFASESCGYSTLYDPEETRQKAKNNDGYAQFQIGKFYQGCNAVEQTMSWYKKAAQNNDLHAIGKLIEIYQSGDGAFASVKDRKKGWPYKEQAAELGSVDYQLDVGFEYLPPDFANYLFEDWKQDGYVTPNPTKSLGLFEKAAKQGSARGIFAAGLMHQYGIGTTASKETAKSYYLLLQKAMPDFSAELIKQLEQQN